MAKGPNFGPHIGLTDERVVLGNFAIREDTYDLPLEFIQVLSSGTLVVLTQRDKEIAVTVEYQA